MSSSLNIYQSTSDLNDSTLENLIKKTQNAMVKGNDAMVEMCISMAEQQEHISKTYKKKDRAAVQVMVMNYVNVQPTTYFKYARAGREYIANPESRHLSMDAVLKKPKQKQLVSSSPKIDYKAEHARLTEFLEYIRGRMGEEAFSILREKFELKRKNNNE